MDRSSSSVLAIPEYLPTFLVIISKGWMDSGIPDDDYFMMEIHFEQMQNDWIGMDDVAVVLLLIGYQVHRRGRQTSNQDKCRCCSTKPPHSNKTAEAAKEEETAICGGTNVK